MIPTLTFDEKLTNYADLAVRVGLGLKPGQPLVVLAPVEAAPLVRRVAERAYTAGAPIVDVMWDDDALTLSRFQHAPRDSFSAYPTWRAEAQERAADEGAGFLYIRATDPDLLAGQDPELVALVRRTESAYMRPLQGRRMANEVPWCIVAAPVSGWTRRVLPDESLEAGTTHLWEALFRVARADGPDPIGAWTQHAAALVASRERLNARRYSALRFTGPGTDLTVGLPDGHLWQGGGAMTQAGVPFAPNIPTEEVFTAPHRDRVDGVVSATKPLNYGGALLEGVRVTFSGGRVIEASAESGEETLRQLLDTDEGARRLGEVALVPHSSPVAQAGLVFYHTLLDENASSHIALGKAYPFCLEGGDAMSPEELQAAGGNDSLVHVDWMIGSGEVDVDGLKADGTSEPVMRAGEWAFRD